MDYKFLQYYFKDFYTMHEVLRFSNALRIKLESSELVFDYNSIDLPHSLWVEEDQDLLIKPVEDKSLEQDAYRVFIRKNKEIHISYGNTRGFAYGLRALKKLIWKQHEEIILPIIRIDDAPSFKLRGIIEGFYGEPWKQEERLDAVDFMAEHRMNAYFYAPKDDLYHRSKWRVSYPEEEMKSLIQLMESCNEKLIDFYYCISPGNDFNFCKEEDFEALFMKLQQVIDYKIDKFALLMDDINYALGDEDKQKFSTPGIAHSYISNRIYDYLNNAIGSFQLVMCPTEYYQNFDTPYRRDLKENLNKNIQVFWTGYNTVAEVIPEEDGRIVKDSFGHELILWDNYPVNDMAQDKLFMGPLVNRSSELCNTHAGMVSNPMIQWHLSKVSVITMAHYMWNSHKYLPEYSWDIALKEVAGEELYEEFKFLCENTRPSLIDYKMDLALKMAIKNKDNIYIDKYFKRLKSTVKLLREKLPFEFRTQLEPWFDRVSYDIKLWEAIKEGKVEVIAKEVENCLGQKTSFGINLALLISKQWGYTDKQIEKKLRSNFWNC